MFWNRKYIFFLLCVILLLGAYFQLFENPFLNFDDNNFIVKNDWIRSFSLDNIMAMFSKQREGHYQPFTWLLYTSEYFCFELNVKGYHFTSLLLHSINTFLIYLIFNALLPRKEMVVFIGSLMYAVHPFHVEPIAWKSAQSTLWYSFWLLLTLKAYLSYLRSNKFLWLLLSLLLFVVSCLAKSAAIIGSMLILLVDFLYRFRNHEIKWKFILKDVGLKVPFFIVSIFFGLKAVDSSHEFGSLSLGNPSFTSTDRPFIVFRAILFYVERFFYPFKLSAIHYNPIKVNELLPFYYYLSPLILIGIIVLIFLLLKRYFKWYEITFLLLFLLVNIIMVSQIVPVGNTITAERYAYLSSAPLAIFLSSVLIHLLKQKNTFIIIASGVILFFTFRTFQRVPVWNNNLALYEDMVNAYPKQFYAHYALGVSYNQLEEYKKAKEVLITARNLNESSSKIQNALGLTYMGLESYDSALISFSKAIKLDPLFVDAYMNRGYAYTKLNKLDSAKRDYTMVIGFEPDRYDAYRNRASINYSDGNYFAAINDLDLMQTMKPESGYIPFNKFKIYQKQGKLDKALDEINLAIATEPNNVVFYNERGLFYNEIAQPNRAEKDFRRILQLKGKDWVTYMNLAISLRNQERYKEALDAFEEASRLNPDDAQIKNEIEGTKLLLRE